MKAKIKETGEIVDVYHEPQHGQKTDIFKEAIWVNGRTWQEDELEFEQNTLSAAEPVDLEKFIEKAQRVLYSSNPDDYIKLVKELAELGRKGGSK